MERLLGPIRLAPGVTGDAERRLMRSVIDSAARESDQVKTLSFTVAGALQASLEAGAGQEFFRRG